MEAYFEQGWEGRIEFAFHFEGQREPFFLKNGQRLTIYNAEGDVLWSGKVKLVRRNTWLDNHHLRAGIWADWKQKGVSYADWMDWFWREPPLKAELEVE